VARFAIKGVEEEKKKERFELTATFSKTLLALLHYFALHSLEEQVIDKLCSFLFVCSYILAYNREFG
jgi:hypothetical protein